MLRVINNTYLSAACLLSPADVENVDHGSVLGKGVCLLICCRCGEESKVHSSVFDD